jgi:hypothetical protein
LRILRCSRIQYPTGWVRNQDKHEHELYHDGEMIMNKNASAHQNKFMILHLHSILELKKKNDATQEGSSERMLLLFVASWCEVINQQACTIIMDSWLVDGMILLVGRHIDDVWWQMLATGNKEQMMLRTSWLSCLLLLDWVVMEKMLVLLCHVPLRRM